MSEVSDILAQQAISTAAVVAKASIKNEQSKKKFKKQCLMLFNTLKAIFAGDPDFE